MKTRNARIWRTVTIGWVIAVGVIILALTITLILGSCSGASKTDDADAGTDPCAVKGDRPWWCDDAGTAVLCGDGYCAHKYKALSYTENCKTCPADCGVCPAPCGDGICQGPLDEDCEICEEDCGSCDAECGDGTCDPLEDCYWCEEDCGCGSWMLCNEITGDVETWGECEYDEWWAVKLVIPGRYLPEEGYPDEQFVKILAPPNPPDEYCIDGGLVIGPFSPLGGICLGPDFLSLSLCKNGTTGEICSQVGLTASGQIYLDCSILGKQFGEEIKSWCENLPVQALCQPQMDCGAGGVRVEFCGVIDYPTCTCLGCPGGIAGKTIYIKTME